MRVFQFKIFLSLRKNDIEYHIVEVYNPIQKEIEITDIIDEFMTLMDVFNAPYNDICCLLSDINLIICFLYSWTTLSFCTQTLLLVCKLTDNLYVNKTNIQSYRMKSYDMHLVHDTIQLQYSN